MWSCVKESQAQKGVKGLNGMRFQVQGTYIMTSVSCSSLQVMRIASNRCILPIYPADRSTLIHSARSILPVHHYRQSFSKSPNGLQRIH